MMKSPPRNTISIHFVNTLIAACDDTINIQTMLKASRINESLLKKPQSRITSEQFSQFTRLFWKATGDEFMGMGKYPCKHGNFYLMAKYATQVQNLGKVYQHICNFYNLTNQSILLDLKTTGKKAIFSLQLQQPSKDPNFMLREFLLMIWHRFPSWLIGQRIELDYLDLDYSIPKHAAEHPLLFPCKINYQSESNRLVFNKDYLDLPIIQTDIALQAYLHRAPIDWFKRQVYEKSFTHQVSNTLTLNGIANDLSMDEIAKQLHLSPRTLCRKLTHESTSFQSIKKSLRRDAAIHHLSQSNTSITAIAMELGFSDSAAFSRAFKQWTGLSPKAYRQLN